MQIGLTFEGVLAAYDFISIRISRTYNKLACLDYIMTTRLHIHDEMSFIWN